MNGIVKKTNTIKGIKFPNSPRKIEPRSRITLWFAEKKPGKTLPTNSWIVVKAKTNKPARNNKGPEISLNLFTIWAIVFLKKSAYFYDGKNEKR